MVRLRVLAALFLLLLPAFSASQVSDDAIYDQVRIRLANDRDIGAGHINVKVTEGIVELAGKVKTDRQKDKAEKIAKKVKGVKNVVNKIVVSPV